MKNFIFTTLLLFGVLCAAQVRFGAKIGGQRTNIRNVHSFSEPRFGYHFGGLAQIPLDRNDIMYFQPELLYSAMGEKNEITEGTEEFYVNFIQLPLLFKVFFNEQDSQFFGELGPIVSVKVGENIEALIPNSEVAQSAEELSSFDIALSAGIGYSFNRKIELNTRFTYGLIDAIDTTSSGNLNSHAAFQVGVSYIFN